MVTIENLRELRHAKPFRAFSIVMDDGRKLPVTHAERMALSPDGQVVGLFVKSAPYFLKVASIAATTPPRKSSVRHK